MGAIPSSTPNIPQLIDIQLIEAIQKTGFAPTCAKLNLFEPLPFEKMYPLWRFYKKCWYNIKYIKYHSFRQKIIKHYNSTIIVLNHFILKLDLNGKNSISIIINL